MGSELSWVIGHPADAPQHSLMMLGGRGMLPLYMLELGAEPCNPRLIQPLIIPYIHSIDVLNMVCKI